MSLILGVSSWIIACRSSTFGPRKRWIINICWTSINLRDDFIESCPALRKRVGSQEKSLPNAGIQEIISYQQTTIPFISLFLRNGLIVGVLSNKH